MDRLETGKILAVIAAAYPTFEVTRSRHDVWSSMLADLDYRAVEEAVARHVMISRFAPSVAEIRAGLRTLEITPAEAWGELMAAVKRHGYYNERDGMKSLRPPVAAVAQMIGWREINLCEQTDVLRGQFLRMYAQVQEREAREATLPECLRQPRPAADLERTDFAQVLSESESST